MRHGQNAPCLAHQPRAIGARYVSKLVWLSDLHFSSQGHVCGVDTARRVAGAVDYINERYSDAVACVVSGDLVDHGTRADYAGLCDVLAALQMPVFPLAGNHDDRLLLREYLPPPSADVTEVIQYRV